MEPDKRLCDVEGIPARRLQAREWKFLRIAIYSEEDLFHFNLWKLWKLGVLKREMSLESITRPKCRDVKSQNRTWHLTLITCLVEKRWSLRFLLLCSSWMVIYLTVQMYSICVETVLSSLTWLSCDFYMRGFSSVVVGGSKELSLSSERLQSMFSHTVFLPVAPSCARAAS